MHYRDTLKDCVRAIRDYTASEELFRRAGNEAKTERYRKWRSERRQDMVKTFYVALEHCPIMNLQNAAQALRVEDLSLSNAKRAIYNALNNSADNVHVMKDVARTLGVDISD